MSKCANGVDGGREEAFAKGSWKMFHATDQFFGDLSRVFHG